METRFWRIDMLSTSIMLVLSCLGLLFIFSATHTATVPYSLFFKKQLFGIISGIAIYFAASRVQYQTILKAGYIGYLLIVALLLFTLIKGHVGMGAQRWVNLGFIKMQPSELTKLFFPAYVAYFIQHHQTTRLLSLFAPIITLLALSFLLILKQPDLGTALILLFSSILMLIVAGIPKRFFLFCFIIGGICAPVLWHTLKPYQKNRVLVFLGYGESHKERYQIEQSTIAIGAGGLLGTGLCQGTQNQLRFVPENQTDFIFAVVCEEWGFLGALIILLLYALLLLRVCMLIVHLPSHSARIFTMGLLGHIACSALINVGMVAGLLPIVGIPLPFMSYGITNLWTNFASMGCIQATIWQQFYLHKYRSAI